MRYKLEQYSFYREIPTWVKDFAHELMSLRTAGHKQEEEKLLAEFFDLTLNQKL